MKTKKFWSIMMMLVLMLGTTMVFSSCGDDEDEVNSENSAAYDIFGRWEESHSGNDEYLELVFNKNGKGEYNVYYAKILEQDLTFTYEYNKDKAKIKVVFEGDDEAEIWDVKFTNEKSMWVTVNGMKLQMIRQ